MAKTYEFTATAHPSIYSDAEDRQLNIYFSEPENGVNDDTGLLLIIAGYGGHAQSNVYQKMRKQFADQYNLVCVQCDYFGFQFMQQEKLEESVESFNDMSAMQALDNLTALLSVIYVLGDNDLRFNSNKIIVYGHSHGAYLAHLCNVFAPKLFNCLIDNSAYIYPVYLKNSRFLFIKYADESVLQVKFKYIAKTLIDHDLADLSILYSKFTNNCEIICFQGITDDLIKASDKRRFCRSIPHTEYIEITEKEVDGAIFKSTKHGDADFLLLFDLVMTGRTFSKGETLRLPKVRIRTRTSSYSIEYPDILPVFKKER